MKAQENFRQKLVLKHRDGERLAILEIVIWEIPASHHYPNGLKYRAWLSEAGQSIFGFDNHKPKGPHLHIGNKEIGYIFRGISELKKDVVAMIEKEGFIYED